jgi:TRAP-type C4-dicarboxylate transport system permease small subunit
MTVVREEPESPGTPLADPDTDVDALSPEPPPLGGTGYTELLPEGGPFRRILKAVGVAEQAVGMAFIFAILALVLTLVVSRYTRFSGWPWTGEIARYCLVWCTFALSGYLMAEDRHITIKVIDLFIRERALGVVKLMSHVIVLATCLGMGYATYRLIADDIGQRTPAGEIPLAWVYVIPLIGFFLTALRALLFIGLVDVRQMVRGQESEV